MPLADLHDGVLLEGSGVRLALVESDGRVLDALGATVAEDGHSRERMWPHEWVLGVGGIVRARWTARDDGWALRVTVRGESAHPLHAAAELSALEERLGVVDGVWHDDVVRVSAYVDEAGYWEPVEFIALSISAAQPA